MNYKRKRSFWLLLARKKKIKESVYSKQKPKKPKQNETRSDSRPSIDHSCSLANCCLFSFANDQCTGLVNIQDSIGLRVINKTLNKVYLYLRKLSLWLNAS